MVILMKKFDRFILFPWGMISREGERAAKLLEGIKECGFKASCFVPESEFDKTQTFVLCDESGEVYSMVDYSVKDYCVRTFASAKTNEKYMIRALYAIGAAATAYLA